MHNHDNLVFHSADMYIVIIIHLACYKTTSSTFSRHLNYKIHIIGKIIRSFIWLWWGLAWKKIIFSRNAKTPLSLREQTHVHVFMNMLHFFFHVLQATLFYHIKLLSSLFFVSCDRVFTKAYPKLIHFFGVGFVYKSLPQTYSLSWSRVCLFQSKCICSLC